MTLKFQSAFRNAAIAFTSALMLTFGAQAEIVPAVGEPILTIDGAIAEANAEGHQLDLASLQHFEPTSFKTSTIWTEGELTFTGVALKTLIEAVGGTGSIVVAEALNGYAVEIPVSDIDDAAPIVAYHIDGKEFSRRDKGPLWVVFPYDSDEKYKSETTYAYSIWQLRRLTLK